MLYDPLNIVDREHNRATSYFLRVDELLSYLQLTRDALPYALFESNDFPFRVPKSFARRIVPADPFDPLLRQILPLHEETHSDPDFSVDPVEDLHANPVAGIVHKYPDRALLTLTGACDVHCRYCFRRHFPYQDNTRQSRWPDMLAYLSEHHEIREIILSGGDPLTLTPKKLGDSLAILGEIPHVSLLRIHSRQPIVSPDSFCEQYTHALGSGNFSQRTLVIHCNHPNELNRDVRLALGIFSNAGYKLLNQSVLLRGVNDDVDTLEQLSIKLNEFGVLPYYLHALDRVSGAAHFLVDDDIGKQLMRQLRTRLPGYLVPAFVRDIPSAGGKIPLI